MNSDRRYVLAMFAAGASGYLLKNSASEELTRAIEAVTSGQKYVSPLVSDAVIASAIARADGGRRRHEGRGAHRARARGAPAAGGRDDFEGNRDARSALP